jgi:hypothetical protein
VPKRYTPHSRTTQLKGTQLRASTRKKRHRSSLQSPTGQSGRSQLSLHTRSPSSPVLRANPYPEVTDLFCRLPLPTLFYRPEAFHLGDLLRIWVRLCTKFTHLSTRFSRAATSAPDVTRPVTLYVIAIPISGQTDSRDHLSVHLIRKDNSSRNLCQRLWIHLCYHTSSA